MLFQTFDNKKDCSAVYANGKLHFKRPPKNLTKTWSYSESLKNENIDYAHLFCGGKTLDDVCPKQYEKEWSEAKKRLEAFHKACKEAKLNLNDHCFYDLVPEFFLKDVARIKNKICNFVFANYEKPKDYNFTLDLIKILTEMNNTELNVDYSELNPRLHEFKVRKFLSFGLIS